MDTKSKQKRVLRFMTLTRLPISVRTAIENQKLPQIRKLAKLYSEGKTVRKNRRVALVLFCEGAELGDAQLAWYAGDAYEFGLGTEKSLAKAELYFERAVVCGSIGAITALGELRWRTAKSAQAQSAIVRLYRRAAKHGEPHAIHNIGVCYASGIGLKKNLSAAFESFLRAAELGHVEAEFKVGWCLLNGEGTKKNRKAGAIWLKRASTSGHRQAETILKLLTKSNTDIDCIG